jgi:hypothetical protein
MLSPSPWLTRLHERLADDVDFARLFSRAPGKAVRELGVPVGEIAALLAAWHDRDADADADRGRRARATGDIDPGGG